jgi:hypothetical protein
MGTGTITLARPNIGELLKVVVFPKAAQNKRSAEMVDRANDLIRNITSVIDDLISAAIEKRTAADFIAARTELFSQYFAAMRALGDLARIIIPRQTIDRLSAEWFCELEADFRDLGPSTFGADLTERGLFTVWTLRKIQDLAQEISSSAAAEKNEAEDVKMASDFAVKALYTRFHVDCLIKAMRDSRPIYPDVVESIRDGLRAAVNTYACIRQWADLKNPRPEPDLDAVEWTDEDGLLLIDSMCDLDKTTA